MKKNYNTNYSFDQLINKKKCNSQTVFLFTIKLLHNTSHYVYRRSRACNIERIPSHFPRPLGLILY